MHIYSFKNSVPKPTLTLSSEGSYPPSGKVLSQIWPTTTCSIMAQLHLYMHLCRLLDTQSSKSAWFVAELTMEFLCQAGLHSPPHLTHPPELPDAPGSHTRAFHQVCANSQSHRLMELSKEAQQARKTHGHTGLAADHSGALQRTPMNHCHHVNPALQILKFV